MSEQKESALLFWQAAKIAQETGRKIRPLAQGRSYNFERLFCWASGHWGIEIENSKWDIEPLPEKAITITEHQLAEAWESIFFLGTSSAMYKNLCKKLGL